LRNLVRGLWIADSALPHFRPQLVQKIQPFFFAVLNRVAQSLADSGIQSGIELECTIEIFRSLIELFFMKLPEATIKKNERRIVDGQAFEKLPVLSQVELVGFK
jgi:hypothetical protein